MHKIGYETGRVEGFEIGSSPTNVPFGEPLTPDRIGVGVFNRRPIGKIL